MTSPSATEGYTNGKKRTNVSLDEELVEWGKKHFRKTCYGSMSNAFEAFLRSSKNTAIRKAAAKSKKSKPNT